MEKLINLLEEFAKEFRNMERDESLINEFAKTDSRMLTLFYVSTSVIAETLTRMTNRIISMQSEQGREIIKKIEMEAKEGGNENGNDCGIENN